MRATRRSILTTAAAAGLAGCAGQPDFGRLPVATQVLVSKSERRMWLLDGNQSLRRYRVELGFQPQGHKSEEGDGRTPEGLYFIDRKNPRSDFHLSLGINYPDPSDVARAESLGVDPGGDIFIHGGPRPRIDRDGPDWTAGCIAVRNREIEEIYAMVRLGTPILITA